MSFGVEREREEKQAGSFPTRLANERAYPLTLGRATYKASL